MDGLTGNVSLNDRDTMCINRVIASDPCGIDRGATGPEPILWDLWFEDSLASSISASSKVGQGLGTDL